MVTLHCIVVTPAAAAATCSRRCLLCGYESECVCGPLEGGDQEEDVPVSSRCAAALSRKEGRRVADRGKREGGCDHGWLGVVGRFGGPLNMVGLSEEEVQFHATQEHVLTESTPIHVLVVDSKKVSAYQPYSFPPFRPNAEGLNVSTPHLSRDELVHKLYDGIMATNVVLLSSPAGSGKTSLLTLFAHRYPAFRYATIAFHDPEADATAVLDRHGVNAANSTCRVPNDKLWVFMLDDCQQQFRDVAFWTQLIKGAASWLPGHIRFIISATHMLETDFPASPVQFESISWKLTRDDFLISDEDAYECLAMENGLPTLLKFPTLLEVIVRECNGHIGSLRVSINTIYAHCRLGKGSNLTEQELLAYYLSGTFLSHMSRCFGSKRALSASLEQQPFLAKCLVCDPIRQPFVQDLTRDEYQWLTRLKKVGIVAEVGCT